jgi:oligoendopeptidase F
MYDDPNYLVNYLYAGLLAVQLFVQDQRDPEGSANAIWPCWAKALIARRTSRWRSCWGTRRTGPALVDADLQVFNQLAAQLRALHARIEAGQGA